MWKTLATIALASASTLGLAAPALATTTTTEQAPQATSAYWGQCGWQYNWGAHRWIWDCNRHGWGWEHHGRDNDHDRDDYGHGWGR